MNMQQMMAQAQKMQRELKKAMAALAEKEFVISKGGAVTVTVLGSKEVKAIEIPLRLDFNSFLFPTAVFLAEYVFD